MREHHQCVLLHDKVSVRQAFIKLIAVLVDDIAKRNRHVAKRNNDVAADIGVLRCLKDLKEKVVVLVAKL
jgi:hypothetical protein